MTISDSGKKFLKNSIGKIPKKSNSFCSNNCSNNNE
jgi:hypothetical protein